MVGFGEADKAGLNGGRFVKILHEKNLIVRCKDVKPRPDARVSLPIPRWLLGWWMVTWRDQAYYYHFNLTQQVIWTQVPPISATMPPLIVSNTGKFIVDPGATISIKWNGTKSTEKFTVVAKTQSKTLAGLWNGGEPLAAVRRWP